MIMRIMITVWRAIVAELPASIDAAYGTMRVCIVALFTLAGLTLAGCAPADCQPVTSAPDAEWDRLVSQGWQGDPTDGMEALYKPGCIRN
jgi:hypothetical protein